MQIGRPWPLHPFHAKLSLIINFIRRNRICLGRSYSADNVKGSEGNVYRGIHQFTRLPPRSLSFVNFAAIVSDLLAAPRGRLGSDGLRVARPAERNDSGGRQIKACAGQNAPL